MTAWLLFFLFMTLIMTIGGLVALAALFKQYMVSTEDKIKSFENNLTAYNTKAHDITRVNRLIDDHAVYLEAIVKDLYAVQIDPRQIGSDTFKSLLLYKDTMNQAPYYKILKAQSGKDDV